MQWLKIISLMILLHWFNNDHNTANKRQVSNECRTLVATEQSCQSSSHNVRATQTLILWVAVTDNSLFI